MFLTHNIICDCHQAFTLFYKLQFWQKELKRQQEFNQQSKTGFEHKKKKYPPQFEYIDLIFATKRMSL